LTRSWTFGRIVRLNLLLARANEAFARELGVERTPTYVLFDAAGQEVKRWVGRVPAAAELPAR
jgi:hypothetical protein